MIRSKLAVVSQVHTAKDREDHMNQLPVMCVVLVCALPVAAQDGVQNQGGASNGSSAPIYRVTVVQRTTKAINYKYRSGPTLIDFRGTVLLPQSKGSATVDSRQGRTEIDARFEKLAAPQRFGREYLTYVLWALTPDGRPHNLGEVVADASDKAHLRVTTDLQAFALIVTAEPYSAVRLPTDIVVMENAVRPDTEGKIEEVQANYTLLPRGQYTLNLSEAPESTSNWPKVSMSQYEMMLEIYQAQNAIGIARSANAEQYAASTLAKAQQLLDEAQRLRDSKADRRRVIQSARQAAETAEDARLIAERRKQEDEVAKAQQAAAQAEDAARVAQSQAQAAQAQADAERAARQRAEAEASRQWAQPQPDADHRAASVPVAAAPPVPPEDASAKVALRNRLLDELNRVSVTRDTPRGLVITIPDAGFRGEAPSGATSASLARICSTVAVHPGLRIEVEGHSDDDAGASLAVKRADQVRNALIRSGLASTTVSARGWGASRPLGPNSSPGERDRNRRIESVIAGAPIGELASWERTYSLTAR